MWKYQQSTGHLTDPNGQMVATCYAGNGLGLNNPAQQFVSNQGPLPQGKYTIGPPHTPVDHIGPLVLPLYAYPENKMGHRFGFFIHGDNVMMNFSASDGCIVAPHDVRLQISESLDRTLLVVA